MSDTDRFQDSTERYNSACIIMRLAKGEVGGVESMVPSRRAASADWKSNISGSSERIRNHSKELEADHFLHEVGSRSETSWLMSIGGEL